jgi:mitogen-activated protein kinase kinase kinase
LTFKIFCQALESNPDGTYPTTRTKITGTKFHHAPEIFRYLKKEQGVESYDAKVDVWALGCVVFEMLTGLSTESVVAQQLGVAENIADMTYLFKMSREKDLSKLLPHFHLRLQNMQAASLFLDRCFQNDPRSRASASELLRDPFCHHDHH